MYILFINSCNNNKVAYKIELQPKLSTVSISPKLNQSPNQCTLIQLMFQFRCSIFCKKLLIVTVMHTKSLDLYLVMSISVSNYVLQQTFVYKLPLDRHLELV